jgi:ABC-2 type transport system ATP-binding protein
MSHPIETAGLTRRFGRVCAVNQLDLRVPGGSIFGLVGPNGAGKTTLIKVLMNLLKPTSGVATVLGKDSRHLAASDFQRIGYISENQRLPLWMTPADLLAFCRPLYPGWSDTRARTLMNDLNLPDHAPLRSLSRGTRMKAALLSSLAYQPRLIVLDEPFSGLDPLVRDELTRALLGLVAESDCTVLISSHDVEELERLVDWIGFIDAGRLLFAEPVSTLLARFRQVEVIAREETPPPVVTGDGWMGHAVAGRILRFIDARHDSPGAEQRRAFAWPSAEIRVTPMTLREIFVALASHARSQARAS